MADYLLVDGTVVMRLPGNQLKLQEVCAKQRNCPEIVHFNHFIQQKCKKKKKKSQRVVISLSQVCFVKSKIKSSMKQEFQVQPLNVKKMKTEWCDTLSISKNTTDLYIYKIEMNDTSLFY